MPEFSQSAKGMRSSEIRRLMALAADPSIISFAGGMPANGLLPTDIIDAVYGGLTLKQKQAAMQYGPTAGYPPLLESLKEYLRSKGLPLEGQDLLITTGAQQAINLLSKAFLDPGDVVVTENPVSSALWPRFSPMAPSLRPPPSMTKESLFPSSPPCSTNWATASRWST